MNRDSRLDILMGGLPIDAVRETLLEAARIAARETLPVFRTAMAVDNKEAGGFDPVTEADRRAEQVIRESIAGRFPDHAISGEEWDDKETGSPYRWVIDPIDGTRSFICGIPLWGTLIGLLYQDRAVAGLLSQPFIGETFIGLPGEATYSRNGQETALRVSQVTELGAARMMTTTPKLFERRPATLQAFANLEASVQLSRYGADCYAYGLLAAGRIDLVVEPDLKAVDIAPLLAIIREAGGIVSAFDGGPAETGGDVIAAATPQLHAAARAILTAG